MPEGLRPLFPHLSTVRESLKLLITRVRAGTLPPTPTQPWAGWHDYRPNDAVMSAQRLARSIASAYRLSVRTIIVAFMRLDDCAARVELGPTQDFFVEVSEELRTRPRDIAAALGHEVAHIFLAQRGIRFEKRLDNEILTDTTAALYGFGGLMADTFVITESRRPVAGGVEVTRSERHMGYLTPEELGYVVTKAGTAVAPRDLNSSVAAAAFRVGRQRAHQEIAAPPLRIAPWWRRLGYYWQRLWARLFKRNQLLRAHADFAFQLGRVAFRCPICCQPMRLPLGRRVTAKCPGCESAVVCAT